MPQRAALVVPNWIVFWSAHVPFCVHRVVQLPPRSTWMLDFILFNILYFIPKLVIAVTWQLVQHWHHSWTLSWCLEPGQRGWGLHQMRFLTFKEEWWGSIPEVAPITPTPNGCSLWVYIREWWLEGSCHRDCVLHLEWLKRCKRCQMIKGRNVCWRPQRFQTGGTRHGARRLPGTRFLVDLEKVKIFFRYILSMSTYNCVDNAQGACYIGRPAIPLPLLVNLEYQIH